MGGSSGAQAINRAARGILDDLTGIFQVLHICGNGNLDDLYERTPGYVQVEYLNEEMADALTMADVVVSRAGSNSICELLALRKPTLLIPYPTEALDALNEHRVLFCGVGVVKAQIAFAAVFLRDAEVYAQRLYVADVQIAVGLGREAGAHVVEASVCQIFLHEFLYKVLRRPFGVSHTYFSF